MYLPNLGCDVCFSNEGSFFCSTHFHGFADTKGYHAQTVSCTIGRVSNSKGEWWVIVPWKALAVVSNCQLVDSVKMPRSGATITEISSELIKLSKLLVRFSMDESSK